MQLSDYGRILSRWWMLIAAGTVLGLVAGGIIEASSQIAAGSPTYQDSANVIVNYPAWPYVPGMSLSTAATGLVGHIHDAGVLQPNPRVSAPAGFKSITAVVDPSTDQIVVTSFATTRSVAIVTARRGAQYLVQTEDNQVRAGTEASIQPLRTRVAHDLSRWLYFVRRRSLLSGSAPKGTLASIDAKVAYWSYQYQSDRGSLDTDIYPGAPPAQASPPGPGKVVSQKPLSPMKSVVPAALVGLALSFLLAAFLDYRRRGRYEAAPATSKSLGKQTTTESTALADTSSPSQPGTLINAHGDSRAGMLAALADSMAQTSDLVLNLLVSSSPSLFVTSPTDAEPKADTAVGLATALTRRGKNVILVDADPAAEITRFFKLARRPGLSDYLGYPYGSITELLYPIDTNDYDGRLTLLPYGIRDSGSAVLVPSTTEGADLQAWSSGLVELTGMTDMVIVSGPCVLDSSEPECLAATMGGAIVVVHQEHNEQELRETYDVLRSHGARVLGTVINPAGVTKSGRQLSGSNIVSNGHAHDSDMSSLGPMIDRPEHV